MSHLSSISNFFYQHRCFFALFGALASGVFLLKKNYLKLTNLFFRTTSSGEQTSSNKTEGSPPLESKQLEVILSPINRKAYEKKSVTWWLPEDLIYKIFLHTLEQDKPVSSLRSLSKIRMIDRASYIVFQKFVKDWIEAKVSDISAFFSFPLKEKIDKTLQFAQIYKIREISVFDRNIFLNKKHLLFIKEHLQQLEEITLHLFKTVSPEEELTIGTFANLKRLKIVRSNDSPLKILEIISHLEKLSDLDISGSKISWITQYKDFSKIHLTSLKAFHIYTPKTELEAMANFINTQFFLQYLSIAVLDLPESYLPKCCQTQDILYSLKTFPQLSYLAMGYLNFNNETKDLQPINRFPQLTELEFFGKNYLTNAGFSSVINGCSSLQSISLHDNIEFESNALSCLTKLNCLYELFFNNTNFLNDETLKQFASQTCLPPLTKLTLNSSTITNDGILSITTFYTLKSLYFCAEINDDTLDAIGQNLTQLEVLEFSQSQCTIEGIRKLLELRPNLNWVIIDSIRAEEFSQIGPIFEKFKVEIHPGTGTCYFYRQEWYDLQLI